jgi:ribokinase
MSSGVAPIVVDSDGRNAIIIVNGANDELGATDIAAAQGLIAGCKVVVTQLEIKVDTTLSALRLAAAVHGVKSIFNPAPARADLPSEFFTLPDVFCCNEPEGELLTGVPVADEISAAACARALRSRGARTVIITLGSRGAMLVRAYLWMWVCFPFFFSPFLNSCCR